MGKGDKMKADEVEYMSGVGEVYCKKCGYVFALYSYSLIQPHGYDSEGKPFYKYCCFCNKSRFDKDFRRLIGISPNG